MKSKAIENRRSVRSYQDKDISKEIIENILEAGMTTPTTFNLQSYKFLVIKKGDIAVDVFAPLVLHQPHVIDAAYVIMVFSFRSEKIDLDEAKDAIAHLEGDERDQYANMLISSVKGSSKLIGDARSAALLLAVEATANNLGSTLFTGIDFPMADKVFADRIDISKYELIVGLSLGHIKEGFVPYPRMNKADKVVFFKG